MNKPSKNKRSKKRISKIRKGTLKKKRSGFKSKKRRLSEQKKRAPKSKKIIRKRNPNQFSTAEETKQQAEKPANELEPELTEEDKQKAEKLANEFERLKIVSKEKSIYQQQKEKRPNAPEQHQIVDETPNNQTTESAE